MMMMMMMISVEQLGETLPLCGFVKHNSHMTGPGCDPGPPLREAAD
jgi:hypothetical protein